MKKIFYLLSLCSLTLFFVACEETEGPSQFENWRLRNEAFMDSLSRALETDEDLIAIQDPRNKQGYKLFFKKIVEKPAGTQQPYFTSTVSVFYRGMLINEEVFASSTNKIYTQLYKNLTVFDGNFTGDDPTEFDKTYKLNIQTSGVISGWIEILQNMKLGERLEVYIPWTSAYGSAGNGSIPGYSVLMFDMTLKEIEVLR